MSPGCHRVPAVTPGLRWRVRANRAFLARATRFLAGEARIGQFLDLGTGIPGTGNTHEVAQRSRRTEQWGASYAIGLSVIAKMRR